MLTILDGTTFCILDDRGDVDDPATGLYTEDTRFLSRCVLLVNGERPEALAHHSPGYHRALFFLRNPVKELERDELTIIRECAVSTAGLVESIWIRSHALRTLEFDVELDLGADFAGIFAAKAHEFEGKAIDVSPSAPIETQNGRDLVLGNGNGWEGKTCAFLSQQADVDGHRARYRVVLEPRGHWRLELEVAPSPGGSALPRDEATDHLAESRGRVTSSLNEWRQRVPRLSTKWFDLAQTYDRSVEDIASLRMFVGNRQVIAGGAPWFMTVFGRDTIVTSIQTLLLGQELARDVLLVLADLQATVDDPEIDAEPGKIVHELRTAKGADAWFARYYGSVDATPLYLVLLSEVWRWTDDARLVRSLREPALRALEWIDRYGDRDGDGFVEYERRSERGIENQSWKDSWDSQVFRDGTLAKPPIAPVEVQGYVHDAKLRAAELAREVWNDPPLAERLEREAAELARRFDEAFWIDERGGYYALGLDAEKRPIDGRASNMGHLLWSGIVPPERVTAVAAALRRDDLWSGWGIRTLSSGEARYNPIGYHIGTVWPHDTSLAVAGLARAGHWDEAWVIARGLVEAARDFGYRLPEAMAGTPRATTAFAVPYPTAASPQAWAAGSVVLLLQACLGLRANRTRRALVADVPDVPDWLDGLGLAGVPAFGFRWSVRADAGRVTVTAARG